MLIIIIIIIIIIIDLDGFKRAVSKEWKHYRKTYISSAIDVFSETIKTSYQSQRWSHWTVVSNVQQSENVAVRI